MKKLAYIDALRAFAILGVILIHTSQYGSFDVPQLVREVVSKGSMGVQLFYVASAFTLFLSHAHRKEGETNPMLSFFIRRVFRIAPMYYLGIAYYLWQDGFGPRYWLGDATHISYLNILSNFTFLHGLNPYWITSLVPGGWSITVEMMFYAMVPILTSRIKSLTHALHFLSITLVLRFVLHNWLSTHPMIGDNRLWLEYLYLYLPSQLPIFALGIVLFFLVQGGASKASGLSLLPLVAIILAQLITGRELVYVPHIQFGIAFVLLALALSRYRPALLVNRLTSYIGKLSFSMYLVHFALLYWISRFGLVDYVGHGLLDFGLRYVFVVGLTVSVSSLFYNQVEVRFQKAGKRLIDSLKREKAVIT